MSVDALVSVGVQRRFMKQIEIHPTTPEVVA